MAPSRNYATDKCVKYQNFNSNFRLISIQSHLKIVPILMLRNSWISPKMKEKNSLK